MAKELPYFRFTAQEWQNGLISLESYELKGMFIDLCSYYWVQDCSVTKAMLEKRFRNDIDLLNQLFELDILKHEPKTDLAVINYLNEQFDVLSEKRKRRQEAGRKGGKQKSSNAKAKPKQNSSYKDKDKDKDKDNLEEFELFWNSYDKKTGKDKCLEKFLKLSNDHKQKIFETLPAYVKSTPDKKFRKNPLTYLNGKHWNDELEDKQNINPALKPDPLVEYAKKQQELYGNS